MALAAFSFAPSGNAHLLGGSLLHRRNQPLQIGLLMHAGSFKDPVASYRPCPRELEHHVQLTHRLTQFNFPTTHPCARTAIRQESLAEKRGPNPPFVGDGGGQSSHGPQKKPVPFAGTPAVTGGQDARPATGKRLKSCPQIRAPIQATPIHPAALITAAAPARLAAAGWPEQSWPYPPAAGSAHATDWPFPPRSPHQRSGCAKQSGSPP